MRLPQMAQSFAMKQDSVTDGSQSYYQGFSEPSSALPKPSGLLYSRGPATVARGGSQDPPPGARDLQIPRERSERSESRQRTVQQPCPTLAVAGWQKKLPEKMLGQPVGMCYNGCRSRETMPNRQDDHRARDFLSRPRLRQKLADGSEGRLILLVAPAGYGKTTLLSEWFGTQARDARVRYTLGEVDNDPARFLAGLEDAVCTACPALERIARNPNDPLSYALAQLFRKAGAAAGREWLVVLDDYHAVTNPALHQALDTLLSLPSWPVHLVIASRSLPPLPAIARLRVEGHLLEMDEEDLRFTPEETRLFFESSGLGLEERELRQVTRRTEGWPVALQLLQQAAQRVDRPDLLAILADIGGERPLFDYLAGQVLDGQRDPVRRFLCRTALLPYLSAELCNAYLDIADASAVLDHLQRSHLFVTQMAGPGRRYR
jgi:LuxR family transcriptional regulator, maltose regulon positive regulatory protein